MPGLVPTEGMPQLMKWVEEIAGSTTMGNHYFERTAKGRVMARTDDFAKHHQPWHDFLTKGIVPELLEVLFDDAPLLFKEKINYKHPFGSVHITMLLALAAPQGTLRFGRTSMAAVHSPQPPNVSNKETAS